MMPRTPLDLVPQDYITLVDNSAIGITNPGCVFGTFTMGKITLDYNAEGEAKLSLLLKCLKERESWIVTSGVLCQLGSRIENIDNHCDSYAYRHIRAHLCRQARYCRELQSLALQEPHNFQLCEEDSILEAIAKRAKMLVNREIKNPYQTTKIDEVDAEIIETALYIAGQITAEANSVGKHENPSITGVCIYANDLFLNYVFAREACIRGFEKVCFVIDDNTFDNEWELLSAKQKSQYGVCRIAGNRRRHLEGLII